MLVSSSDEAKEEDDILLMCNTPYQQPIISWYKDDILYPTAQTNVLRVARVTRQDAGIYKCRIGLNNLLRDSNDVAVNISCMISFFFVGHYFFTEINHFNYFRSLNKLIIRN